MPSKRGSAAQPLRPCKRSKQLLSTKRVSQVTHAGQAPPLNPLIVQTRAVLTPAGTEAFVGPLLLSYLVASI